MITKYCFLLIPLLVAFSAFSQIIPQGKPLLLTASNDDSKFTVPAGKKWVLQNVKSNANILSDCDEIIVLKELNDKIYTDISKSIIGPVFYSTSKSLFGDENILPMYLDENTSFKLLMYQKCTTTVTNVTTRKVWNNIFYVNILEYEK